ncbi:MAG: DUF4198 domain-containing protein [Myxococcota bacterium]
MRFVMAGLLALVLPALAAAHDFILWPELADDIVSLRLLVHDGEALGDERAYRADRVSRFFSLSASGRRELAGGGDEPPFARVPAITPGGHWIAVDRVPIDIELEAGRFEGYLAHEGLRGIRRAREMRGETAAPGRERYTRHLKAFVQRGDVRDGVGCRALGQDLEVVFLHDPAGFAAGHGVEVELREAGAPVAGHPLDAYIEGDADVHAHRVRTDGRGRARIALRRAGRLVVRTVRMKRCTDCGGAADWVSRWTAATVDIAAEGPAPGRCASPPAG